MSVAGAAVPKGDVDGMWRCAQVGEQLLVWCDVACGACVHDPAVGEWRRVGVGSEGDGAVLLVVILLAGAAMSMVMLAWGALAGEACFHVAPLLVALVGVVAVLVAVEAGAFSIRAGIAGCVAVAAAVEAAWRTVVAGLLNGGAVVAVGAAAWAVAVVAGAAWAVVAVQVAEEAVAVELAVVAAVLKGCCQSGVVAAVGVEVDLLLSFPQVGQDVIHGKRGVGGPVCFDDGDHDVKVGGQAMQHLACQVGVGELVAGFSELVFQGSGTGDEGGDGLVGLLCERDEVLAQLVLVGE